MRRVRDLVRVNGYASLFAAVLVLASVVPAAGSAGISRLAVAGLALALLIAAGEAIGLAVGRRLRRRQVVPFAAVNAAVAAACVVLASTAGLPSISRFVVGTVAVAFGSFAVIEAGAARSL